MKKNTKDKWWSWASGVFLINGLWGMFREIDRYFDKSPDFSPFWLVVHVVGWVSAIALFLLILSEDETPDKK